MAQITISDGLTTQLEALLTSNGSIEPGSAASYELCKTLWEQHPLGGKLVEKPVMMALFKPRENNLEDDPDRRVVTAFEDVWLRMGITEKIRNLHFVTRCYGAAAIGVGTKTISSTEVLPTFGLQESDIFINVFDPLNAAGSMVTSQDPNAADFQEPKDTLAIAGKNWHVSRTMKVFNGAPIYLGFQASAFGFTGRSVFQRALYPLKSFIQTMKADNLVSQKAGVLVAKTAQNTSVMSGLMAAAGVVKRAFLKDAKNDGVISIGPSDSVESLNLQNIDGALTSSRDNVIANIAAASDTPAILIKDEAFANGFGEGSEDSRAIAQYIDGIRQTIDPAILFFEGIVQYVAWNEEFFTALAADYPEQYAGRKYEDVFYEWRREFSSKWPDLLEKEQGEVQAGEAAILKQATETYTAVVPNLDPENLATATLWLAEIANTLSFAEDTPLTFDYDALANYVPPVPPVPENGNEETTEEEEEE